MGVTPVEDLLSVLKTAFEAQHALMCSQRAVDDLGLDNYWTDIELFELICLLNLRDTLCHSSSRIP